MAGVKEGLFTEYSHFADDGNKFMMSMVTFLDFKKSLEGLFDTGAAVILYEAGLGCGRRAYQRMNRKNPSKKEVLETLRNFKFNENWGKIKFDIDLKSGRGFITVSDSFEGKLYDFSPTPVCHYLRGYIGGFLSEMFGRELEIREIKCVAIGDKNCIFEIK